MHLIDLHLHLLIQKSNDGMKRFGILLIWIVFYSACNRQSKPGENIEKTTKDTVIVANSVESIDSIHYNKKDRAMNERYDYETTKGGKRDVYLEKNGWIIRMTSMTESGAFYDMSPPSPAFYEIQKLFYSNGNIKSEEKFLGRFLKIDTSRYYEEDGYLAKEVYEDKKFGIVKPAHILKFLDKEGWINLKTGKGRTAFEFVETYPNNPNYTACIFELQFEPIGESYFIKDNKMPIWVVVIPSILSGDFYETTYLIDGETGKVIKKERKHKISIR